MFYEITQKFQLSPAPKGKRITKLISLALLIMEQAYILM